MMSSSPKNLLNHNQYLNKNPKATNETNEFLTAFHLPTVRRGELEEVMPINKTTKSLGFTVSM